MRDDERAPTVGPPSGGGGRASRQLLRSLHNRNYRRYLLGHGLSNVGLWIQQTAELWLILQLTGSGTAVGMHSILRFGPVLFLGAYGGLLSDRIDRRRLLIGTQTCLAISALVITVAAWMERPSLILIYAVVLVQGLVNSVDNPTRRAFVRDLVANDDLANAVSLQSSVATSTRAIGPAIAGLLIAGVGIQWCFTINAFSYSSVLAVLFTINRSELRPQVLAGRGPRLLRRGLTYAWDRPVIRETLFLCFVVGIFGWNWTVLVPFYVTDEFTGGASLYGSLVSLLSVGAVVGALLTARLTRVDRRHLVTAGAALVVALLITMSAPTLPVAAVGLFLIGATSTAAVVGSQARIQVNVDDTMSGRVLALFSVVFVGSKPLGGLIGGWLTDLAGSRTAFGVGGAVIAAAVVILRASSRSGRTGARPR